MVFRTHWPIIFEFASGLRTIDDTWLLEFDKLAFLIDLHIASHNYDATVQYGKIIRLILKGISNPTMHVGKPLPLLCPRQ